MGPGTRTRPSGSANRRGRRRPVVGAIARGSGGGDGPPRRRLGRPPPRRAAPPHGGGLGHHAQDPPRAPAALTHQDLDLDGEHEAIDDEARTQVTRRDGRP